MEWTKEMRYRRIEDVSEQTMKNIEQKVNSCEWRQNYHIQPNTGLLNDPNGFAFYNGEYHLFYQWFPLGPVHGLKYWYHTKSKDMVNWENVGIGIQPDRYYDSHGAYSGSAIEHNNKLYLMYTGNTRNENWERHPYQILAVMDESGKIQKPSNPVISEVPNGYTDHFRDPKVWKTSDGFYAVIGAQRINETGCVVLYHSEDLEDWNFLGEIKTKLNDFGYMWECPDYFEVEENGIFILSPQGIEPDEDSYQNIYQSGYLIGEKLDLHDLTFNHGDFIELDHGFDFYAPQTTLSPDGRRILVGWMGLPDIEYPSDKNEWAHCMTLPREITVKNKKLLQKPVHELTKLRTEKQDWHETVNDNVLTVFKGLSYEMICEINNIDADVFGIEFRARNEEKTVLMFDKNTKKAILDRSKSGQPVAEEYGTTRKCSIDTDKVQIQMFVDTSSVEIFINDGEEVFTSRIFPDHKSNEIRFFAQGGSAEFQVEKWDI